MHSRQIWACYFNGAEYTIMVRSFEEMVRVTDGIIKLARHECIPVTSARKIPTTKRNVSEYTTLRLGRGKITIGVATDHEIGTEINHTVLDENPIRFAAEPQCIWDVSIEDGDDISNDDANDLTVDIEELMCLIEEKHSDKE